MQIKKTDEKFSQNSSVNIYRKLNPLVSPISQSLRGSLRVKQRERNLYQFPNVLVTLCLLEERHIFIMFKQLLSSHFLTLTTDPFLLNFRFEIFLNEFSRERKGAGRERKIGNCSGPQFPHSGESVTYFGTIEAERHISAYV